MKEKFNFKDLCGSENYPELKIAVQVAEEQLEKGISEKDVLVDILEFVNSMAKKYYSKLIIEANKQIAEDIEKLAQLESWINLGYAAKHAMELKCKIFEKEMEGKNFQDILALFKLQEKVLNFNIPDLKEVFNPEWLKKEFPSLIEHIAKTKKEILK